MPEPIGSGTRSLLLPRTIRFLSFVMLAQLIAGSLAFAVTHALKQAWLDDVLQVNAIAFAVFAVLVVVLYGMSRRRKQVQ